MVIEDLLMGRALSADTFLLALPQFEDICWKGAPSDMSALDTIFPKVCSGLPALVTLPFAGIERAPLSFTQVFFVFAPQVKIRMKPVQYLFRLAAGTYCLGLFDNQNAGTLLGGISVRNTLVQVGAGASRI